MRSHLKFYIGGRWVNLISQRTIEVINPATEAVAGCISLGIKADIDLAVLAARSAFVNWSLSSRETRLALLRRILLVFKQRQQDLADAISKEMGAPRVLASNAQAGSGISHMTNAINVLQTYQFEQDRGSTRTVRKPIEVCGLITPWKWPINQIMYKVAPAIASSCTLVLKPSELSTISACIFAEILDEAGVPAGVSNLVNGDGNVTGTALSAHRDVDMISFTGCTRAGVSVAKAAAPTVKRVTQELGGKSPNIILPGADLKNSVSRGVAQVMQNSGQSCNAPTRMPLPFEKLDETAAISNASAGAIKVGDPTSDANMRPVVSRVQWENIQRLIENGIDAGAVLVTDGLGRPEELAAGYYVKPTIFARVTQDTAIAREEIFGPVLTIHGYGAIDEAVAIGNDTGYGLAGCVWGAELSDARAVAARLRAGQVKLNGAPGDLMAPFGGYKMSGNGREWADHGFAEFLETKAIIGFAPHDVFASS